MRKRLWCVVIFLLLFGGLGCVRAAEAPEQVVPVPAQWQEVLDEAPVTAQEFQAWSFAQMGEAVWQAVREKMTAPVQLLAKLCGMLVAVAAGKSLCAEKTNLGTASLLDTVGALAAFSLASSAILELMNAMQTAVESSWAYLASFAPVFSSVLVSCGQTGSAALYGGVFLSAANLVAGLLCRVGFPFTQVFLALVTTAAVGDLADLSALAACIEKWVKWLLLLCATVFGTVLALQSVFANSADTLALKTGKFLLSSSIPVVGRAVSDAMGGVLAGIKLLKGSVGFAAVAVLAAVFFPLVVQCVVYQCLLSVGGMAAGAVGEQKSAKLLHGLAACVGLFLSMAVFFCFVVVSATVVMILLGNGG